jgi:hypothetical protein
MAAKEFLCQSQNILLKTLKTTAKQNSNHRKHIKTFRAVDPLLTTIFSKRIVPEIF